MARSKELVRVTETHISAFMGNKRFFISFILQRLQVFHLSQQQQQQKIVKQNIFWTTDVRNVLLKRPVKYMTLKSRQSTTTKQSMIRANDFF